MPQEFLDAAKFDLIRKYLLDIEGRISVDISNDLQALSLIKNYIQKNKDLFLHHQLFFDVLGIAYQAPSKPQLLQKAIGELIQKAVEKDSPFVKETKTGDMAIHIPGLFAKSDIKVHVVKDFLMENNLILEEKTMHCKGQTRRMFIIRKFWE